MLGCPNNEVNELKDWMDVINNSCSSQAEMTLIIRRFYEQKQKSDLDLLFSYRISASIFLET